MAKLSDKAWQNSLDIIEKIRNHPFNKRLADGSLPTDIFAYYIEQDIYYLHDFARCHNLVASRLSSVEHAKKFMNLAQNIFGIELENVHQKYGNKKSAKVMPARFNYCNFLMNSCANAEIEVAIASLLPCFWVYYDIGMSIKKTANNLDTNIYASWINNYSDPTFENDVIEVISLFNDYADKASPELQQKMIEAFYYSVMLEYQFFDDSYYKHFF